MVCVVGDGRTSYDQVQLAVDLAEHHKYKAIANKYLYGANKKRVKIANFAFREGFVQLSEYASSPVLRFLGL